MTATNRRLLLSIFVVGLYLPVPILAAFPSVAPWISHRLGGVPLSILVGVGLMTALVLLAWVYAGQSQDAHVHERTR